MPFKFSITPTSRLRRSSLLSFTIAFIFAGSIAAFTHALAPDAQMTLVHVEGNDTADSPTSGNRTLDQIIVSASERHGVDPQLIHAVIWRESNYRSDTVSSRSAGGLMQLIPVTARRFGCNNARDPEANVEAGTRLLRYLLTRFRGDVRLALAGYNAGEGAVERFGGVPPFAETQRYVRAVIERYGKTQHPMRAPLNAEAESQSAREIARLARRN